MTHEELRAVLARLGLTQTGAARLLGVDGSTVRRWLTDKNTARDIPPPAVAFLRLIDECPAAFRHVQAQAKPPRP